MNLISHAATEVCITVDIEFNVNGALEDPGVWSPAGPESVHRMHGNRSHGLGFILETLAEFDLRATFFVEVLNAHYFGQQPMARIMASIREAGQDLALHVHGCWKYFQDDAWRETMRATQATESIEDSTLEQLVELLHEGADLFAAMSGHRPTAFRMGSLQATPTLFQALHRVGLRVSSNIGVAIHRPAATQLELYCGVHRIAGVTEVPVLTYADVALGGRRHLKNLTVTGASTPEMLGVLRRAHDGGVSPVVILTHASEFSYEQRDTAGNRYVRNAINQARFRSLCAFLAARRDTYHCTTFHDSAHEWQHRVGADNRLVQAPLSGVARRILENNVLDRIARSVYAR